MVRLGVPHDIEKYYMAEGELAFKLHQMGFQPAFRDDECLYFKKNGKLIKALNKLGEEC